MNTFILKHNGEAVIKIYTIFDSISFIAYDYEILNPSELPYMLSDVKKTDYDSTILSINHWIAYRSIPYDRYDLDDVLSEVLGYKKYRFGRMYYYRHIANILSYYVSAFDHYIITPEKEVSICFAQIDERMETLWRLKPYIEENVNDKITRLIGYGEKSENYFSEGCIRSNDLTIRSGLISWWEGKSLHQKALYQRDYEKAKLCEEIYNHFQIGQAKLNNKTLVIPDIAAVADDDIVWRKEVAYLSRNKKEKSAAIIERERFLFGNKTAQLIENIAAYCKNNNCEDLSWNIGIYPKSKKIIIVP